MPHKVLYDVVSPRPVRRVPGAALPEPEGGGVVHKAVAGARLAHHALDNNGDGHAVREAVRFEHDVWHQARVSPREGHGGPQAAADAWKFERFPPLFLCNLVLFLRLRMLAKGHF